MSRPVRGQMYGNHDHLTVCALACTIFRHIGLGIYKQAKHSVRWLLDIIFISCSVSPQHLISAKVFLFFFMRTHSYLCDTMDAFCFLYYRTRANILGGVTRTKKEQRRASLHAKQVLFLDLEDLHYFTNTHTHTHTPHRKQS